MIEKVTPASERFADGLHIPEPLTGGGFGDNADGAACRVKKKWTKPTFTEVKDLGRIVKVLANLPPLEYAQRRKPLAKKFNIRALDLDDAVKKERGDDSGGANNGLQIDPPEPWDEAVNGADLLNSIRKVFNRYLILPDHADTALSLWTAGTYVFDNFQVWPKLLITSPEKRCGKTRNIEVCAAVSRCAMPTSNITAAALFRTIGKYRPSLMIDEADTFLKDNDELRGVINSGHRKRSAYVIRCTGDNNDPEVFSTWCPMVIGMIKLPADTIVDRSVIIQLRRKLPGEKVARLGHDLDDLCEPIRRRAERWAEDHAMVLKDEEPDLPHCVNDREIDNWMPLFAIANVAGGEWPERVRKAFKALVGMDGDDDSIGPMILHDIRTIFDEKRLIRVFSGELVEALVGIEESPWGEWKRGRPMTQNSLARLLKPYKIKPKQLRIGREKKNGYERSVFEDAFNRYLPPVGGFQPGTPVHPTAGMASSGFQTGTEKNYVPVEKTPQATDDAACTGVSVKNEDTGERGCFEEVF